MLTDQIQAINITLHKISTHKLTKRQRYSFMVSLPFLFFRKINANIYLFLLQKRNICVKINEQVMFILRMW